jgi:hypothetical protein
MKEQFEENSERNIEMLSEEFQHDIDVIRFLPPLQQQLLK